MTDIRNVISPLNAPTMLNSTNFCKTPESDRQVSYSSMGFLETDTPHVLCPVKATTVTSIPEALAAVNSQILAGSYFAGTRTLLPSDLDPCRFLCRAASGVADATLTFPNPGGTGGLIPYLKQKYGADAIQAGLFYRVKFMNDQPSSGFNVTLSVDTSTTSGTANTQGWDDTANPIRTVSLAKNNAKKTTVDIGVLIGNTTPGSEAVTWYAL